MSGLWGNRGSELDMTYLDYINQFWQTSRSEAFSSNEVYLYFFLLNECNNRGWENPFECSNRIIVLSTGISEPTVIDCRNRLQQKGLINFEAGKRNAKSPVYYLNNLSKLLSKTFSKTLSKTFSKNPNNKYKDIDNKTKEISTIVDKKKDEISFETVWEMYERKGNKKTSEKKWATMKNHCREAALKHIPQYVESTPDKQFRKNFETYLNQECWNDEIIFKQQKSNATNQSSTRINSKQLEFEETKREFARRHVEVFGQSVGFD